MYTDLFELHKNELGSLPSILFKKSLDTYGPGSSLESYQFIITFLILFYNKNFSLTELSNIITDSACDGGIDAFYFGNKTSVDIFEFKFGTGGISDKDIDKIKNSLEKYLKRGNTDFIGDEAIKKNIKKLKKQTRRKVRLFIVRKKHPFTKIELMNDSHGNAKIKKLIRSIEEEMGIEVIFKDINTLFLEKFNQETVTGNITLAIESDLLAKNQSGSKEIIAKISIETLFKQFIQKYGTKIISSNIRGHLNKKAFSEKIVATLRHNPNNFWIFHNGITITCTKISPLTPNATMVTITNPQIVNGAQTLFGLFEAYNKGIVTKSQIKKGSIICKIIEADTKLSKKICETSNTQNAVSSEDLVSNEEINIFLENYINKISKGQIKYKRKKGHSDGKDTITSTRLFQWVYAAFLEEPSSAKNDRQFLFDMTSPKGKFVLIENKIRSRLGDIWKLCSIGLFVEGAIKKEKSKSKKSKLRHMDLHLIAALFHLDSKNTTEFNRTYALFNDYYKKQILANPDLNENKVFTKTNQTWQNVKKKL